MCDVLDESSRTTNVSTAGRNLGHCKAEAKGDSESAMVARRPTDSDGFMVWFGVEEPSRGEGRGRRRKPLECISVSRIP